MRVYPFFLAIKWTLLIGLRLNKKNLDEQMNSDEEKFRKAYLLMNKLGIPCQLINFYHTGGLSYGPSGYPIDATINITDLYDILMDDGKLKDMVSLLKNKAFW